MDARDATANNADLWSQYLRQQWSAFLNPLGLGAVSPADFAARTFADVAAANIASVLSALLAPPVARMYATNAPDVTRAMREIQIASEEHIEIPEPYMARPPAPPNEAAAPIGSVVVPSPAREAVIAY